MKLKALLGWSIGSFTSATLIGAVGLLHLRFLTDSLGISIGLAGSFVVLSRLYDAAFDPVMGVISDYTRTPFGRYRPYLLIGGLLAAASLIVMFNVPYALKGVGLSVYVIFSLFFFSTAYTMFRIPYLAIGRSITQDFTERSRLMSFSVYGSSLGGLAATAAAPFLLAKLGSDRAGHGLVALLLAGFIAAGAIASFILIKADGEAAPAPGVTRHRLTVRESLAALRANHPFQCLISFKMLMFAGLSVHISSIPYYTRYVLKRSDTALSSIFLAQTLAMMASQFVWVRLARRFGRRNALLTAGLLQTVTMLCWFLVPRGSSSPWVQILGAMEGFCGGGMFFGLYTVLTDTMDYARRKSSGAGQEGILAGIFVMVEKATTAFGTAVFGGVLASVGYISAHNAGTAQPPAVLTGICISMSVIPAALGLIACLFIYKYRLPGLEAPASPVDLGATESVSPLGMPTA